MNKTATTTKASRPKSFKTNISNLIVLFNLKYINLIIIFEVQECSPPISINAAICDIITSVTQSVDHHRTDPSQKPFRNRVDLKLGLRSITDSDHLSNLIYVLYHGHSLHDHTLIKCVILYVALSE